MSNIKIIGDKSTLVEVADKIRALDGSSNELSLSDIKTKLNDEKNSIDAALAALVAKGVEVPEGANSGVLAELIAAISPGVKIAKGSFTPTEDLTCSAAIHFEEGAELTGNVELQHNLGVIPKFGFLYVDTEYVNITLSTIVLASFETTEDNLIHYAAGSTKQGNAAWSHVSALTDNMPDWCYGTYSPVCFFGATTEVIQVVPGVSLNGGQFTAGKPYYWVLVG